MTVEIVDRANDPLARRPSGLEILFAPRTIAVV
jgi:hypothetical protein